MLNILAVTELFHLKPQRLTGGSTPNESAGREAKSFIECLWCARQSTGSGDCWHLSAPEATRQKTCSHSALEMDTCIQRDQRLGAWFKAMGGQGRSGDNLFLSVQPLTSKSGPADTRLELSPMLLSCVSLKFPPTEAPLPHPLDSGPSHSESHQDALETKKINK